MTLDIKKFHNKMLGHDVEAVQLTLQMDVDTLEEVSEWVNTNGGHSRVSWGSSDAPAILLHTLGGWHVVALGEWIIYSKTEGFSGESQSIMDVIFEEIEELPQTNDWIELAARICHETNRIAQIHAGEQISPSWDLAPDWQRESRIEGVKKALEGQSPEQLHESWCDFKVENGWRYGPVKDEVKKTHPCLVPYSELPVEQKLKDHLFSAVVQSFRDAVLL